MSDLQLRVAVICTGNICRSPMAEVVLRRFVTADPALTGHVIVTSAGTARWHVGSEMDPRARSALDRAGYTEPGSPGAYADATYLNRQDLIAVMTREHEREVRGRLTRRATEVVLWRGTAQGDLDVADPYYGDDLEFDDCLRVLCTGATRVLSTLHSMLADAGHEI